MSFPGQPPMGIPGMAPMPYMVGAPPPIIGGVMPMPHVSKFTKLRHDNCVLILNQLRSDTISINYNYILILQCVLYLFECKVNGKSLYLYISLLPLLSTAEKSYL